MKQIECDHCGDTVVIPQKEETVVEGETPVEHMERAGHPHKREPVLTACPDCEFAWYYGGTAARATCPNCRGKVEPGGIPDHVEDAWERAGFQSNS